MKISMLHDTVQNEAKQEMDFSICMQSGISLYRESSS